MSVVDVLERAYHARREHDAARQRLVAQAEQRGASGSMSSPRSLPEHLRRASDLDQTEQIVLQQLGQRSPELPITRALVQQFMRMGPGTSRSGPGSMERQCSGRWTARTPRLQPEPAPRLGRGPCWADETLELRLGRGPCQ
jgi:hypothetical protein